MLITELPIVMVRCLIITIFVEIFVAFLIGIKNKKDFLNVILVNIVTNPLVVTLSVFFEFRFQKYGRNVSMIFLELFAFLFEGFIYTKFLNYRKLNGFIISLILNLASYFTGVLVNLLLYS